MSSYDNWKTTDPSLEGEWEWVLACEDYEESPKYQQDLAEWLSAVREADPKGEYNEADYQISDCYNNAVEDMLKEQEY